MANRIYLLTGAAGFLGNNIAKQLIEAGCKVRGLVLEGDPAEKHIPQGVDIIHGDLTDKESLARFFEVDAENIVCIHCASIVYLKEEPSELVRRVNVDGTQNIIDFCLSKNVEKLVFVSSTGTVSELPHGTAMKEPEAFVMDDIVGYYGKTKAMATQLVMDAVKNQGLKASIVYPTGICGPNDYAHGPVSTFIIQYCNGETKMGIPGSFNSVDVRDLAAGTIACVDKGRIGEGYILGNEVVSMKEMFQYISEASGVKIVRTILPMAVAKLIVKGGVLMEKITKKEPLFTELMLYNLVRNNAFDSSKARKELGYTTRPFSETIRDEVIWLKEEGQIQLSKES
ncbi:nucleoside-diphosphate sugar epimerase [Enterococcus sp. JM4C]|uniref:NAD-dependent epimerase/dehydratase family protein n=1 Tax=Candidatus Enterococcus huntleyi TaxID=1857217 RepID=UPI00137B6B35|nr:NAD-dependent epimerase/dehydratase family protein [Enterococcus sp. JM4C]KAF1295196.1 nucleoside-diphosphate sugar epimerase [Enterococcus sp. JM4C]